MISGGANLKSLASPDIIILALCTGAILN